MKGSVLNFSERINAGAISGDDGNLYNFSGADWKPSAPPRPGARVDFGIDGNAATAIYADPSVSAAPGTAAAPAPTSRTAGAVAAPDSPRYSTMGIVGTYAGVLAIFFFNNAILGFPLMLVGITLSVAGLIIGTQQGHRVGFANAGIALSVTPILLHAISAATGSLVVGGSLQGTIPALLSAVLPFF